jgi:hypothetical protein
MKSYKGTRDPRFVTVRRGGSLEDKTHRMLAAWAADCAEHVLHLFSEKRPGDGRPARAIGQARAWARGEITMTQARDAAYAAHEAAREASGSARLAARAAGHAVATAHMADHELGAAAYAIKAVLDSSAEKEGKSAAEREREWQRSILPEGIRELVISDQKNRNKKLWSLFY